MKYALLLTALLALPAAAEETMPAAAKPCMGCHQIDKTVVGPAFREVAGHYRADPAAEARIVGAISKGSKGVWGGYAMPAQDVGPEEARAIARWIMSL